VGVGVVVALQLAELATYATSYFDEFLRNQPDLGTKWSPRYVRVATELPQTETSKVIKRQLRAQRWQVDDLVYFRPKNGEPLRRLTAADVDAIRARFAARDRLGELDKVVTKRPAGADNQGRTG